MTLKELPAGKTATVQTVGGEGALRQHFLDMGLIPGADVTMVKFASARAGGTTCRPAGRRCRAA